MGDRPQEIRPDPLLLRFIELAFTLRDHLVLPGEFRGHGAGRDGDDQHTDEGDRISGHREIDLKERVSKASVDEDHTEQGGENAVQVSCRPSCDEDEGKDIDQRDISGVVLNEMKKYKRQSGCRGKHDKRV